uniref:Eukaryotic aspartyl protease family protein n=1 Tax=Rhizophora mucronata TaxID=61149 RepID=A0A2P2KLY9_RHIMU
MQKLFCLSTLIISNLVLIAYGAASPKSVPFSFSINLIHVDSPLSPFHNHSLTSSELLRLAAHRSATRIDQFQKTLDQKAVQSTIYPGRGEFLMKLSIGTPPVELYPTADTGSELIWVQCSPQQTTFFDPSASSTNQELLCSSQSCQGTLIEGCSSSNECVYNVTYADRSQSRGILSTDTFTFDSTAGQAVAFPASVFGCGYDTRFPRPTDGIVGLDIGPLSLVSQLSDQIDRKFSYCLVPLSSGATSKLRFGPDAIMSGAGVVSTPFVTKSNANFYCLTLEGISVGPERTQTPQGQGNIIIDSGTTLTYLETSFYNELEAIVKETIGGQTETDPSGIFKLCYGAQSAAAITSLEMVFHFSGADLLLQSDRTFQGVDDLICMNIVPNDALSIFGNLVQVNFQVEYDLQARQVSFAPADCTQK